MVGPFVYKFIVIGEIVLGVAELLDFCCFLFFLCCEYSVVDFFRDYSARKKRRVIYDLAISQLETCKQNTQTYKIKITKQKKTFDRVKKLQEPKLKNLNEPVPKEDLDKNKKEMS